MSLKLDLRNIKSVESAKLKLRSIPSFTANNQVRSELDFYYSLLSGIYPFDRPYALPSDELKALDEAWSLIPDPRVRALLSANVGSSYSGRKLAMSLIPELPLKLLLEWPTVYNTLLLNPKGVVEVLKKNNVFNSSYVTHIWENFSLFARDSSFSTAEHHPVLVVFNGFFSDETIPLSKKLKLCSTLQTTGQRSFGGSLPVQLFEMEAELIEKFKTENNLEGVPSDWVAEMLK